MFKIKVGRKEYQITSKDRFLDNGACVQLITQEGLWSGWYRKSIILPKREISRLDKIGRTQHSHKYGEKCSVFSISI